MSEKQFSTRSRLRTRRWPFVLLALLVMGGGVLLAADVYLGDAGITPRALSRYLLRRAEQHNPAITSGAALAAGVLSRLDRGDFILDGAALRATVIQRRSHELASKDGREVLIATAAELVQAVSTAEPGDQLVLLPGSYRLRQSIEIMRPGDAARKIVLRARQAGTVVIEFDTVQGFVVSAPDWTVENLILRGVCANHGDCDHAFHVVAAADRFTARNNTILDFNAHFKINGEQGRFPDNGLIEGNVISNDSARQVGSAVSLIDLVGASGWVVRRNFISDFIKAGGDGISYGAFFKGGGSGNVFEQNIVLCEDRQRGLPGQRVGLSLGGGGTGAEFCRDRKCITEQDQGVIQANLVAACSDDGIYLNSAARSRVRHNTLIDTAGIEARFPVTVGDVDGNLVDGPLRIRNGAVLRLDENRSSNGVGLFTGMHPVRSLFSEAPQLGWHGDPPRRSTALAVPDLCGVTRPAIPALGAFEKFSDCAR